LPSNVGNYMNRQLTEDVLDYIDRYWARLIRSNPDDRQTLIGLPKPYIVPSDGEMFQEMYYWDSYFMALGLIGTEYEGLVIDMTDNMAYLFQRFGVIPNATRYYFLSRSQPPFFSAMIRLSYKILSDRGDLNAKQYLSDMIKLAEQEHDTVWLGERQPHHRLVHQGLSRNFDVNFLDSMAHCESGWDHSTRCDERFLEHLPVDLNAILASCEMDIAWAHAELGNDQLAQEWEQKALNRNQVIRELMWDEDLGFFFDYDYVRQTRHHHASLAGFFPLWSGTASAEQAKRIVDEWLPQFEKPGGLVTSLDAQTGRQWAAPNGWAPLQWLVTAGLERYGFKDQANRVRKKWLNANCLIFEKTGALWEKYNVVDVHGLPEEGLYGSVRGFGWTNAVFANFEQSLQEAESTDIAHSISVEITDVENRQDEHNAVHHHSHSQQHATTCNS
jgi:alpha,alpha-trehalase